ncbi:choline ABC transporter substrate-binding protein [Pseudomonas marincola]|uniref:choline ABC transporter substrate-binding protein n=1 Tax=Pseudomonas marincola TaxID=437900 RepID=UPI0008EA2FDB|nr:choline ABC transporter substrate-binding protein [Pseudomonas marincola]SFT61641.1 glycine betaine/proline transport system substrate-binding protein [Pseudomonas marincola]
MNRLKLIAAGCVLALSSSSLLAAEQASCKNVRVGLVGWTDVVASTAVASTLLEGLGYETKQTQASQQIIFAGIQKDQIDVFLGYWKPIMDDNIKPFLDKKAVKVMPEPSLNDAVAVLAVPTYTADKGLKTLADIAKFKDQLDGKIYGIDAGSGANIAIKKMIDSNQFGLGDFKLVESSEAGMLAAVNRATRSDKPVVFFGWKPHPMNLQFPITYLTGTEDVFGPNDGAATVSTVTAPDYAERCPNANLLLSNLRFTSEQESQLMQPIMDRKKPEDVAREWIKANPEIVSGWLQGVTTFDGKPADSALAALK